MRFLLFMALFVPDSSYCSPSGDVCYGIEARPKQVFFRVTTVERYFSRYTLCVRPPRGRMRCGSFPIFRGRPFYSSTVRWSRQYPNRGAGVYRVTWRLGSRALGPTLRFRR